MSNVITQPERTEQTSWLRPKAMLRELEELFSGYAGIEPESWIMGRLVPALDLTETNEAIEVRMDLPGINAKDIDIRINGNLLTINGERKEEKEQKGTTYHRMERRSGRFSRSVTLPCQVVEDNIDANYHGGVLTVMMPKAEAAKSRKIDVKS